VEVPEDAALVQYKKYTTRLEVRNG